MPEVKNRVYELRDELRSVTGRVGLLDTVLPPVFFLILNGVAGFQVAMIGALGLALVIGILRVRRSQSLLYAAAGMASVGLAIALVYLLGRSEGYFLPGIVNGGLTITLALVSLIFRRPIVAWTSYVARRWPLEWYWHPKVRPAYTEVTLAWILYFSLRLIWQIILFQGQDVDQLALVNVLTGWPATLVLLIISYLYGVWRLRKLGGPSVDEFRNQKPPPWASQQRGF